MLVMLVPDQIGSGLERDHFGDLEKQVGLCQRTRPWNLLRIAGHAWFVSWDEVTRLMN